MISQNAQGLWTLPISATAMNLVQIHGFPESVFTCLNEDQTYLLPGLLRELKEFNSVQFSRSVVSDSATLGLKRDSTSPS